MSEAARSTKQINNLNQDKPPSNAAMIVTLFYRVIDVYLNKKNKFKNQYVN